MYISYYKTQHHTGFGGAGTGTDTDHPLTPAERALKHQVWTGGGRWILWGPESQPVSVNPHKKPSEAPT